ncbi:MAG: hypothetical protein AAF360_17510 [Pseudomonadota bacterium]
MEFVDAAFLLRAGLIGVLIWVASQVRDSHLRSRERAVSGEAYIRALYAEIDFNTRDLRLFVDQFDPPRIEAAIRADASLVPHITDARHTQMYMSRLTEIHSAGGAVIFDIVDFYGALEKIRTQIEGISAPSYRSISPEGRVQVIRRLRDACEDAEHKGRMILGKLEISHSALGLARREA